jgi:hypothetical protein
MERMRRVFEQVFEKLDQSDYEETMDSTKSIRFDGAPLNLRNCEYHELSPYHDMNDELKLRSKSLMSNLVLSSLQDIVYHEDFSTLQGLYDDFSSTINEFLPIISHDIRLESRMKELDVKSILKLMDVFFTKDDLLIHPTDFDYEEYLLVQIALINHLASKNRDKTYFGWIDVPILTKILQDRLSGLTQPNLHLIAVFHKAECCPETKTLLLLHNHVIDLADDVSVYNDILLPYPAQCTFDDIKPIIAEYLIDGVTERTKPLLELI